MSAYFLEQKKMVFDSKIGDDLETKYNKLVATLKSANSIYGTNSEHLSSLNPAKKFFIENNYEKASKISRDLKTSKFDTSSFDLKNKVDSASPSKHYYEIITKSNQDEKHFKKSNKLHALFEYDFTNFLINPRRVIPSFRPRFSGKWDVLYPLVDLGHLSTQCERVLY